MNDCNGRVDRSGERRLGDRQERPRLGPAEELVSGGATPVAARSTRRNREVYRLERRAHSSRPWEAASPGAKVGRPTEGPATQGGCSFAERPGACYRTRQIPLPP